LDLFKHLVPLNKIGLKAVDQHFSIQLLGRKSLCIKRDSLLFDRNKYKMFLDN